MINLIKKIKTKSEDYFSLKKKIFLQMFLLMIGSLIGIWALYSTFWFGKIADPMVSFFQFVFQTDYNSALSIYQRLIRNNMEGIMLFAASVCFFLLFWFFLNWFTKYFGEINRGIDALIVRDGKEIHLSKEMKTMEVKLNFVRKTLEQQFDEIQAAEQKKDELIMYLAHDIRTPLTSVIGYLSLMEEMPNLTEEQRQKFLQITLSKASRLEILINEFFDITRYGKQGFSLSKEKIDLYYMLVQLVEESYPALNENNKQVEIKAKESCIVYADGEKLARVFQNMLKNAIFYSEENSTITIEAEQTTESTIIRFSNYGKTIPKEKLIYLFDKFYRMDEARQTHNGGAGLGLAIAKELVEMHGGTIGAESENNSTIFTIIIPIK